MSSRQLKLIFTTFLLGGWISLAYGSPDKDPELVLPPPEQEKVNGSTPPFHKEKNLSISPPPKIKKEKKEDFYYPWNQSMGPRFGLLIDINNIKEIGIPYTLGLVYLLPKPNSPQWEAAFDLASNSDAHIDLGLRWTINERNAFRFFYKASVTHQWKAENRLASLTDFNNYWAKGTIGMEDVLKSPASIRLEGALAVGVQNLLIIFYLGYTWGW